MSSTEVREGDCVLDRGRGEAQLVDEDGTTVGAGDTVHAVEEDLERVRVGEQERLDQVEIEDGLQELDVVLDRVDDLDLAWAIGEGAKLGKVNGRVLNDLVGRDRLCLLIDLVGDVLWGGPTVRDIVFDTEVGIGASRVVRGSEEDTAIRLVLADDVRRGGGREDRVLADDESSNTVGRADLKDGLDGLGGEETTIATDDKSLSLCVYGVEDGLDEVLRVVLAIVRC